MRRFFGWDSPFFDFLRNTIFVCFPNPVLHWEVFDQSHHLGNSLLLHNEKRQSRFGRFLEILLLKGDYKYSCRKFRFYIYGEIPGPIGMIFVRLDILEKRSFGYEPARVFLWDTLYILVLAVLGRATGFVRLWKRWVRLRKRINKTPTSKIAVVSSSCGWNYSRGFHSLQRDFMWREV